MSKIKYITKIQNVSFELISKFNYNEREYVKIKSIKEHEAKIFYAFSSKILFGLWKIYYDGQDEFLESIDGFEDVVSNLLCIELQKYIYDNLSSIPIDINMKNEIKRYKNSKLVRSIFNGNRLQTFFNHEDTIDENIYNDLNSLVAVSSCLGVKNNIIDKLEENLEEEVEIEDSEKINMLKSIKTCLTDEFKKFTSLQKDCTIFTYKKEYTHYEQSYMILDIKLKLRQISILNKPINVYYINYNLENLYSNKKYNDLKYIVAIVDVNYLVDEYGMYLSYYDNLYNKLGHLVYDDETFFDEDLIDTIRICPDDNIIFVGHLSNLEF